MALNFIFGCTKYKILDCSSEKVIKSIISNKIPIKNFSEKDSNLSFEVSFLYEHKLKKIIPVNENVTKEYKGLIPKIYRYRLRFGIFSGAIISLFLIVFLSNIVLEIDIKSDDGKIKKEINALLSQYDIGIGTFIPSIDFAKIEDKLMLDSDEFGWVTLRNNGCILVVDVVENTPIPEMTEIRRPTNLVATKSGVITKVDVKIGKLVKVVGRSVKKGDILVSGNYYARKIREEDKPTLMLKHSKGNIYADYNQKTTFYQPYNDTITVNSNSNINKNFISIFSAEIPISINSNLKGNYIKSRKQNYLYIFGHKTPISTVVYTYNEFYKKNVSYTKNEVINLLYESVDRYESNFLSNKTIKTKKINIIKEKNGIKLEVDYILNGNIAREKEIVKIS